MIILINMTVSGFGCIQLIAIFWINKLDLTVEIMDMIENQIKKIASVVAVFLWRPVVCTRMQEAA